MNKRINEDITEIEGRTFVMKKFDALLGNYILVAISTTLLPFGIGDAISKAFGADVGTDKSSKKLNKEEFIELEKDILKSCYERLPAGDAPIITQTGYGVADLTPKITIQLLINCLIFNFKDFFDASLLTSEAKDRQEQ